MGILRFYTYIALRRLRIAVMLEAVTLSEADPNVSSQQQDGKKEKTV